MSKFYTKTTEEVFEEVESSTLGLSPKEAKTRLEKNGKNELAAKKKKSGFVKFLGQFKDILILVLIASCIISVVFAIIEKNYGDFIDAGIIVVIVFVNAIIGFVQERNSEKAMESLQNMTKPYCKVLRNGKTIKVKSEELVVGDVVVLEAGDIVPADLRLIETSSLKIEESALTGESVAVEKDASQLLGENAALGDRVNMAFMGSICSYGRGTGVVVACGMNTEIGKIATALNEMEDNVTPLTKRIKATSIIITFVVLAVCATIFLVEILRGGNIFTAFSMAIAIAVCAVPEGLPACNTVTMSIGVKNMSEQRAIVKKLPAVETLGSTEVICSDKTGTLTLNQMTVKKVFYLGELCEKLNKLKDEELPASVTLTLDEVGEKMAEYSGEKTLVELMRCMLLCNDTKSKIENNKLESIGDPTEIALVHYGYKFGITKENTDGQFPRLNEIPFDSDRKLMTTFHKVGDKLTVYTKGAVDNILSRCNRILDNGKIRKITNADKELILQKNTEFASKALRMLAFATKTVEKIGKPTSANTEFDLCFIGLVGMIDPPREEVKDAIKTCKQAGITTVMITGDHKDTAFAIAKELGICGDPKKVITGQELDEIPDEAFATKVNNYQVYARVSPEHKVRIVKALKANDKIVAMTGDGVNDAPSIKSADIGVGMGITGTDVTKEAADMILTDDNFTTIVGAVKEGRRIYNTILKILVFLIGTSIAELFIMTVTTLVFRDYQFFSPALLLWINFVSDTFVGLALGFEKAEPDIMKKKPIKTRGNLFKGEAGFNIFVSAVFVAAMTLGLYAIGRFVFGLAAPQYTTMCFLFICFAELLHAYNLKSQTNTLFSRNIFKNKILNWSFLGSALLTVLVVILPLGPVQVAMGLGNITWWQWLISLGMAVLIVPYIELVKWIIRLKEKRKLKVGNDKKKEM